MAGNGPVDVPLAVQATTDGVPAAIGFTVTVVCEAPSEGGDPDDGDDESDA